MKSNLILAVATFALLTSGHATAQGVFDDVDGRTTILTPVGAVIGVNTGDPNVEVGYVHLTSTDELFYGAALQATSKEGVGSIFGKGDFSPGAALKGLVGYKVNGQVFLALQGQLDWFQTALVDSTASGISIAKDTHNGWEVGLHGSFMLFPRVGMGGAIGLRTSDNYTDLGKVTVNTITSAMDSDGRVVEVVESAEGRQGAFRQDTVAFLDIDVLTIAAEGVSIRPFGRFLLNLTDERTARNSIGVDIALYDGDPLLGRKYGIVFQVYDNLPGEDKPLEDRIGVAFSANVAPLLKALIAPDEPED